MNPYGLSPRAAERYLCDSWTKSHSISSIRMLLHFSPFCFRPALAASFMPWFCLCWTVCAPHLYQWVPTRPCPAPGFSSPHSPRRASSPQAGAWSRESAQPKAEQRQTRGWRSMSVDQERVNKEQMSKLKDFPDSKMTSFLKANFLLLEANM